MFIVHLTSGKPLYNIARSTTDPWVDTITRIIHTAEWRHLGAKFLANARTFSNCCNVGIFSQNDDFDEDEFARWVSLDKRPSRRDGLILCCCDASTDPAARIVFKGEHLSEEEKIFRACKSAEKAHTHCRGVTTWEKVHTFKVSQLCISGEATTLALLKAKVGKPDLITSNQVHNLYCECLVTFTFPSKNHHLCWTTKLALLKLLWTWFLSDRKCQCFSVFTLRTHVLLQMAATILARIFWQFRDAKSCRCCRYICAIFSAGANFWAIWGHFWAILGNFR